MSQDIKCLLGLHKYEVKNTELIRNPYGAIIGTSIIIRCSNCGKIKEKVIYTDSNYKLR